MSDEQVSAAVSTTRRLEDADLPALLELLQHLHRSDEPLPDMRLVRRVWQEFLCGPCFQCFGAWADGLLVASCTLAVVPNLTRGCRPYGVIENVVTHSAHRRRGWGRAVLRLALDEAWRSRCHKVVLTTGRKDEEIVHFYEGAGFDSQARRAFVAGSR